ncbi:acetoin dehydrogenase dihydrolipoyllysine-residue acetyltransferase subunit [Streptomyces sp. Ru71]|uniref:acetoin dehydrogenase dihydrolipoyllysine-residue acetyltransferase subunit n=1 Tax=Streptomyces sp. Ru71 TaxID=2080746 RepID=UPI000CDD5B04|nr:acetoin dehydrogenase dihydrolipoyllysine-residue acetyltransferase subunit [Streptomyces sp. Ru71]POX50839.1 acetoin dehydrogenase dihydrolipoyllysine-residue acetyltransferase subunit [Streptomyces sp. Ru71]
MADERIGIVTMPKWGLSMKTGKIMEWVVAVGDEVEEGDDLAEIDTDKIAGTLESTHAGVVRHIVAEAGSDAPVGCPIAVVAPADVPQAEIDEVVRAAEEQLARGAVDEEDGPRQRTVEVDGRTIAYTTLGDGEDVVVLVHGYGGDKNSWLFVQEPLSQARTVHALDLPGHGDSAKDVGDGSLDGLAGTVLGFLDALGVERAHLVGHSMGGAVVTAAAAAAPQRVRSLTLVSPAGFGPEMDAGYLRGFATAGSRRELRPHLLKLFADEGQVTRRLVDDLLKYKRLDGVDLALKTLLGTLLDGERPAIDALPLLAGAGVPTVVVWGRDDQVIPASNAARLPASTSVHVVDGAGHMAHMETPAAVVAAVEQATGNA